VLIRRQPAQNSQQTHESAYVLRDPAALPEAEQVTARGLADAVSHARATMKMRMLLGTRPVQPVAGAAGLEQALADGALDTATGACLDFTNSPSGQPGQPCTASLLDSLACSNAVATRRHLPRLAWLHRALDEPPSGSFDGCRRRLRRNWSRPVRVRAGSVLARMFRYDAAPSGPGRHQPSRPSRPSAPARPGRVI
jgi:hypothetical protein